MSEFITDEVYKELPYFITKLLEPFQGRERDIVFLSMLSGISSVLPNYSSIYMGSKVFPPIYTMIIAKAGTGKGVMNFAKDLIDPIHTEITRTSMKEILECQEAKKESKITDDCPNPEMKIIPADISGAKFYKLLEASNEAVIIIESEADTLANASSQEWGNLNEKLRKAFHHETVSVARRDFAFEIKSPQLAILISGTFGQLLPLVSSIENGLFSRFLYYEFEDEAVWKSPFKQNKDLSEIFKEVGHNEIFKKYNLLKERTSELKFKLSEEQQGKFNEHFKQKLDQIKKMNLEVLSSNINRLGLGCFRLCMIFTALTQSETIKEETEELMCSDLDFERCLKINDSLFKHTVKVFEKLNNLKPRDKYEILFEELSNEFKRMKAVEIGKDHSISTRTVDGTLKRWVKEQKIIKVKNGQYKKS